MHSRGGFFTAFSDFAEYLSNLHVVLALDFAYWAGLKPALLDLFFIISKKIL
jgi:hypothetical protein